MDKIISLKLEYVFDILYAEEDEKPVSRTFEDLRFLLTDWSIIMLRTCKETNL